MFICPAALIAACILYIWPVSAPAAIGFTLIGVLGLVELVWLLDEKEPL